MFEITFSAPGRYEHLARILEQNLRDPWPEDLLEKLHVGLIAFRSVWTARGGARLGITVGDALLVYLGIYSLDSLIREGSDEIGKRISRLRNEYIIAAKPDRTALIERREDAETVSKKTPLTRVVQIVEKTNAAGVTHAADIAGAVAGIAGGAGAAAATRDVVKSGLESVIPGAATGSQEKYSPANPLRIAFMHEKSTGNSGWVYGHELGRNHLKDAFGSLIQTMSFENCSTEEEILNEFSKNVIHDSGEVYKSLTSLVALNKERKEKDNISVISIITKNESIDIDAVADGYDDVTVRLPDMEESENTDFMVEKIISYTYSDTIL